MYVLNHVINISGDLFDVDSPGVPPSANAHELFRGFSFIASCLLDDNMNGSPVSATTMKSVASAHYHPPSSSSSSTSGAPPAAAIVDANKPIPDRFKSVRPKNTASKMKPVLVDSQTSNNGLSVNPFVFVAGHKDEQYSR